MTKNPMREMVLILNGDHKTRKEILVLEFDEMKRHWMLHFGAVENGPGLDRAEEFKNAVYDRWKSEEYRKLNIFHQGGSLPCRRLSQWQMFEFWSGDQNLILKFALEIADAMQMELEV